MYKYVSERPSVITTLKTIVHHSNLLIFLLFSSFNYIALPRFIIKCLKLLLYYANLFLHFFYYKHAFK